MSFSNLLEEQNDNKNEKDNDLKILIDFKFNVEQEVKTITSHMSRVRDIKLDHSLLLENLDIYSSFILYKKNIETIGNLFLEKQEELQIQIDKILMDKCCHNWIYDVVEEPLRCRDICYCSNCFIYKNPKK